MSNLKFKFPQITILKVAQFFKIRPIKILKMSNLKLKNGVERLRKVLTKLGLKLKQKSLYRDYAQKKKWERIKKEQ